MVTECLADIPIETLTVVVPFASGAGVNVSVPVDDTAGCTLKSPVFTAATWNVSAWPLSFAGPALMPVAQAELCGPLSSFTVLSGPLVKLGSSFTALTVMVNVWSAD